MDNENTTRVDGELLVTELSRINNLRAERAAEAASSTMLLRGLLGVSKVRRECLDRCWGRRWPGWI